MYNNNNNNKRKLKHKSLFIEVKRMWNLKCKIIPVIIGTTRIVTKGLRKNLKGIPGKRSIDNNRKQLYWEHHM
jgi:hypothetical protein